MRIPVIKKGLFVKNLFIFYIFLLFINNILFAFPDTVVHDGIGTQYYDANVTDPACCFPWPEEGSFYCAMNSFQLHLKGDSAIACGAFIQATSDEGQIVCYIIDECPYPVADSNDGCWNTEHIDISRAAFRALTADTSIGIIPLQWKYVPGDLNGPIYYHYLKNTDGWWLEVQIRNHIHAIKNLEIKINGQWEYGKRTAYNYFIFTSDDSLTGPFDFRVTATTGEIITDNNVAFTAGQSIMGSQNFNATPITFYKLKTSGKLRGINSISFKIYNDITVVQDEFLKISKRVEIYNVRGQLLYDTKDVLVLRNAINEKIKNAFCIVKLYFK